MRNFFKRLFGYPTDTHFGWRTRSIGGSVPRCEHCHAAFGMCAHTGGPLLPELVLDQRVREVL